MDTASFSVITFVLTLFLTLGFYGWGYANGKRIGIIEGQIKRIKDEIKEIEKGVHHA